MTAPTDPFRLTRHLIDDHGVHPDAIEPMDSDELRAFHARLVQVQGCSDE